MTTVHILFGNISFEGQEVIGVYETYDTAWAHSRVYQAWLDAMPRYSFDDVHHKTPAYLAYRKWMDENPSPFPEDCRGDYNSLEIKEMEVQ